MVQKTNPDGSQVVYTYDQAGNQSITTPSGTVTTTVDELYRIVTVTDSSTGTTTYTYTDRGNLKTIMYPNGATTEYTYDDLNRLISLVNSRSDGTAISSYTYTLDDAGNRTKVVEHSGRTVEYEYDDMNKLVKETISDPGTGTTVITYTYDAVGNRLTKTENGITTNYTYDDNNRLMTEEDMTYTYDNNGNLIGKDSSEEQVTYVYDYENRLIRVETTKFGATIVVEYEYDALGHRIRKTIDGLVTTTYVVDANRDYAQVLEERDSNGTLLVRYVYGHDLISQERSGTVSYYHYDGLGSTRVLTNDSEAITDTYTYDAFGNLLDKTGATNNNYLFTGEQLDANVGLYYLRARYINPSVGRFITMDEFIGHLRVPYSLHKYLYVSANPVRYVDPSGYTELLEREIVDTELIIKDSYQLPTIILSSWQKKMLVSLVLGLEGLQAVGMVTWPGALQNIQDEIARNTIMVAAEAARDALAKAAKYRDPNDPRPPKHLWRGLKTVDVKDIQKYDVIRAPSLRETRNFTGDLEDYFNREFAHGSYRGRFNAQSIMTDLSNSGFGSIRDTLRDFMQELVEEFYIGGATEALDEAQQEWFTWYEGSGLSVHTTGDRDIAEKVLVGWGGYRLENGDSAYTDKVAKIVTPRAKYVDLGMDVWFVPFLVTGHLQGWSGVSEIQGCYTLSNPDDCYYDVCKQ